MSLCYADAEAEPDVDNSETLILSVASDLYSFTTIEIIRFGPIDPSRVSS